MIHMCFICNVVLFMVSDKYSNDILLDGYLNFWEGLKEIPPDFTFCIETAGWSDGLLDKASSYPKCKQL